MHCFGVDPRVTFMESDIVVLILSLGSQTCVFCVTSNGSCAAAGVRDPNCAAASNWNGVYPFPSSSLQCAKHAIVKPLSYWICGLRPKRTMWLSL